MVHAPTNESSLSTWLQEHRPILVKVARVYARGEADIAELQQEMLYQLWISLPKFSGEAKASTWVYRVCLNTALTWKRGTVRRESRIQPGGDFGFVAADELSPSQSAEQREWLEKLYAALQTLSATERALVLLMLDGLTYREIADVTGMTENHVGVALTRARKRLATQLKGVTDELG